MVAYIRLGQRFSSLKDEEINTLLDLAKVERKLQRTRVYTNMSLLEEKHWNELAELVKERVKTLNTLNPLHKYTYRLQRENQTKRVFEIFINDYEVGTYFWSTLW
jgi:hypothetical protein